ncbi:MAG: hypothetical protein IKT67_04560 [Lachnospiraceae bacterium]|nr:hypothetical protein [Lachnospiraceae bacterium]
MKMKKRIVTVSVVLVLACAIVALYWYIDRSGKQAEEPVNTAAEQLLAKSLETNYPPTPYSVAELYCEIVQCIYSADTTDAQLEELVRMERELFDEEFAAINPYDSLLASTKEDLATAKEKKLVFTGYILDKASNVTKWKRDGKNYASIMFQFMSKSESGSGGSYRNLIMRKDSDGNYKILGWETADGE